MEFWQDGIGVQTGYSDMTVTRHDGMWTFLVESESRKGSHMVDISENNKNGRCACEDYSMRKHAMFLSSGGMPDDRTRCKHIIAAREFALDDLIDRDLKNELPTSNPKREEHVEEIDFDVPF